MEARNQLLLLVDYKGKNETLYILDSFHNQLNPYSAIHSIRWDSDMELLPMQQGQELNIQSHFVFAGL
ncbi:hypothetical protein chiPu_0004190 [Chiloscyllium punctatum]|uniref:Uncharacterized protein n=1 Tax=Chiloscyllium punctatum TaxID=137246 RepID=A0A401S5W4_CHIPU|nr:hypothetical protein [Chiloscyllium punctatum]